MVSTCIYSIKYNTLGFWDNPHEIPGKRTQIKWENWSWFFGSLNDKIIPICRTESSVRGMLKLEMCWMTHCTDWTPAEKKSAAGQPLSTRASFVAVRLVWLTFEEWNSEKNVTWCNMTWTCGSVEFGSMLPPLKKRMNNHGGGSWTCWGKPTCEICMFHHFPAFSMP
jgi:hypothetical protein